MKERVLTGMAMIALLVLLFFSKSISTYPFDFFIVLVAIYAGYEMSNILSRMGLFNSSICIVIYPILSYVIFKVCQINGVELFIILALQVLLAILISAILSIIYMIAKKRTENEILTRNLKFTIKQFSVFKGIQTLFGMLYPSFIILLLVVINNLENLGYVFAKFSEIEYSISLFLMILTFLMPVVVDTFAMLIGSLFKGKKLCPKISPNKTISGAVGGFIWGVLVSLLLFFILRIIDPYSTIFTAIGLTWWKMLIFAVVSGILCQVGDIFESLLKRKAGVKDSGDLLPGHGGILDRFDSHIANILVVFIFMLLI